MASEIEFDLLRRLITFTDYFVEEFETNLTRLGDILEERAEDPDTSGTPAGIGLQVGKNVLGALVGAPAKTAVEFVGNKVIKYLEQRKLKKSADGFSKLVYDFKRNECKPQIRKIFVESCIDIFQSYEMQFMHVTTKFGAETRALLKIAKYAVEKIIVHYAQEEITEDLSKSFIIQAITFADDANDGFVKRIYSSIKKSGRSVNLTHQDSSLQLNTKKLFTKVGLLIYNNEVPEYYKTTLSKTIKYGYRRLFDYEQMPICEEESNQFMDYDYKYIINSTNTEDIYETILSYLNDKDIKLSETRITETISLSSHKIIQELKGIITSDTGSLRAEIRETADMIKDIQVMIQKNVPVIKKTTISFQIRKSIESFTGRSKELNQLQAMFSGSTHIICINGLGGIGKSELVKRYIDLNKKTFAYLIWINAETSDEIRRCFHKLALELQIPIATEGTERELSCIIDNIYEYLSIEKSLIVFDNVLSRRDINNVLPTNNINVIITSQNKQWGTIPTLNLSVLTMEESINFIKNSLTEYHLQEDINDIMNLAIAIQYLPLALQQAVSYIQHQNYNSDIIFTTKDYLNKFNEEEEILDSQFPDNSGYPFPDFSDNDYSKTICLTLKLALTKVDQGGARGKSSMEVLNILAYLSPDYIHKSLILETIEDKNETTLKSILLILVQYSLIDIHDEYINMHRLVQKVLRFQQKNSDKPYFLKRSFDLALSDFNSVDSPHSATVLKHAELLEHFLLNYFENVTDSLKYKLFLTLVYNGVLETIRIILETSKNIVHCVDSLLKSPLHYSCSQGHEDITKLLINTGASTTNPDIDGFLPIHNACLRGHIHLLSFLINNETNINIASKNKLTPLHQAAKGGHIDILEYLIEQGADPRCKTKNDFTALHLAAAEGYSNIVKVLVKVIDINATTIDNITPLHEAAFGGHTDIVSDLLRLGANKNIRSTDGYTPIFGAVAGGHPDLLELLIDEETRNNRGALPLHVAAQAGLNEMCEILLRYSNIDDLTYDGYSPIYFAAASNHTQTVKLLIDHNANFIKEYPDGKTIMYIACQKGNAELLKLLLEQEIDIDYRNIFGETPLYATATSNHLDCMKMLIAKNSNVDLKSIDGTSPLLKAVSRGYLRIVSLLIDNNACVNLENLAGMSVLLAACSKGFLQITKLLKGATINHVTQLGLTALYAAATKGHTSIVQLLLSRGADVNLNCKDEISPLQGAARPGHLKTVRLLLQYGANVNAISEHGMTALMEACLGSHLDVFQLLVDHGGVIERVNKAGKSVLHMAAEVGCCELVKVILNLNMDVNTKTYNEYNGLTPLHMACSNGHLLVVRLLLENGAHVNIDSFKCFTPLHSATAGKHVDVMKYLIVNNADVNAISTNGIFPLLMAVKLGCTEAVQLLLDNGADYRKTSDGTTLLQIAVQNNHFEIIELLLEKGLSID